MTLTARELAERIGAEVRGEQDVALSGCAALADAGPADVTFLANRKYVGQLETTRAGAVVIGPEDVEHAGARTLLVSPTPYYAFRNAAVALVGFRAQPSPGISEQASIAASVKLGEQCHVGPFVTIADGASVGDRCVIHPGCCIGREARIGDECVLYPNVTIYDRCVLGQRVVLHAGCSIGQDGFGYATHPDEAGEIVHHKIPPIGIAVIEDDVEMGACCTVDRATLGATIIGAGSKFSNNVTIGHGSKVGRHNLLVGQVGLAGSTKTGDYVAMGGQAGVAGHLEIGTGAQLAAQSGVVTDLPGGTRYGGAPAVPITQAKRQALAVARLPEMMSTLRRLQKRIEQLEAKLSNGE